MTTAIFHKGKQTCSQCSDNCNHCQTERAAHPANRPHLAAHWLPCPTHPDPEFLQHQRVMRQKPVYDQGLRLPPHHLRQCPPRTRRPRPIPAGRRRLTQRLRTRIRSPHRQRLVQRPVDPRRHRLSRPTPTRPHQRRHNRPRPTSARTHPDGEIHRRLRGRKYPPPTRHRRLGSCRLTRHPPLANQDAITFPPQIPTALRPMFAGPRDPPTGHCPRGIQHRGIPGYFRVKSAPTGPSDTRQRGPSQRPKSPAPK